ncbi:MAG TPA: SGNH/GDSL hydrolase family protein [Candidatus Omnitrophota bacterium]|nr:SGNH/GDSL hydrolase family protein [Candidatus Omnitrophota bacterium]
MKKNVILAILSLLLALSIAEIVLRFVGLDRIKFQEKTRMSWVSVPENIWIEHHSVLGWYSQKNKTAVLTNPNFPEVSIHTNAAGFRGLREYAREKPSGVIRSVVLGDSFVFGFGVPDDATFPALLEAADKNREVLNLGIPGYGVDQIYLSYKEIARPYHPDIVMIGIFPEDFWRCTRSFTDSGHVKPYFTLTENGKLKLHNVPVPPPFSLNSNQFPPLLEQNMVQKLLDQSVLYRLARKPLIKLAKNIRLIDPDSSEEWIIGRVVLHELIVEVRKDGAVPVLVLMPPQDWAESTRKTSLERSLLRFAEREKVKLINLKPAFNEAVAKDGLEAYYIKGDWHWTAKGHQLAAEVIQKSF